MGKSIEIEMTVKVKVKLPLAGASADELALAIGPVRNEIGRELMRLTVESVQEAIVERERLPRRAARHGPWTDSAARCRCTSFTKQGWRRTRRRLRTSLGEVGFRVHNVQCRRCGVKYAPVLRFFDVEERKRRLSDLERVVAEVVSLETYGKSEGLVEQTTGERVPDATIHDWVADIDWDELKLGRHKRAKAVMADSTGFKKRGGRRGDLRVIIGVDRRNKPFALGVYSGLSADEIGKEVKSRLKGHAQATLFVHDGEEGLSDHLAGIAEKEARCKWHLPRGLKYALWEDGLRKAESDPHVKRLKGVIGIEIPDEDWQKLKDEDLDPPREELKRAKDQYRKLADEFGDRGYENARGYLENAMDKVFTQVETWLNTGLVMPGTICTLERIMRELGRRLKRLGYGWTDEGITRVAKILLKKVYEPEDWDRYWEKRADLSARCRVVLQETKVTKLSIIG